MIKFPHVNGRLAGEVATRPGRLFGVDRVRGGGAETLMHGRMRVDERHRGTDGLTAVGALGVLADEVLGFSIITSLPPPAWTVSTEIWIDLLHPLPTEGPLTAEARTVSPGSFAVGGIFDADGVMVAECRERGRRIDDVPDSPTWAQSSDEPDPVAGSGLAKLLGLALEELPRLCVTPELENPRKMLHGGVSLAACELVATSSRVREGSSLRTTSVHVVHTRPVPHDSVVTFEARTVHAGGSLWVTEVAGKVDGRLCVSCRVSAQ